MTAVLRRIRNAINSVLADKIDEMMKKLSLNEQIIEDNESLTP